MKTSLLLLAAALLGGVSCREAKPPAALRIVKQSMWHEGTNYEVRGTIHNPRKTPAEEVKIAFTFQGKDFGRGKTGQVRDCGSSYATINYLPPGASVDFVVSKYVEKGEDVLMMKTQPVITEK